ncbi:MAG: hypothetical protein H0U73_08430 [Tatlockia sp.]|nr:hypothetical protein [Tatlockia sp.]
MGKIDATASEVKEEKKTQPPLSNPGTPQFFNQKAKAAPPLEIEIKEGAKKQEPVEKELSLQGNKEILLAAILQTQNMLLQELKTQNMLKLAKFKLQQDQEKEKLQAEKEKKAEDDEKKAKDDEFFEKTIRYSMYS